MSVEPEDTQRGLCQQQRIPVDNSKLPGDGGMGNPRTDDIMGCSTPDVHNILTWCSGGRTKASGTTRRLAGDVAQHDGPVDIWLLAVADSLHQALLGGGVPSHLLAKVEIISHQKPIFCKGKI